ncbi:Uncharacterised protein [Escherichia coli]|uniref:Uncharacterized protein n=1 Tax=Escherichia coli TaxID=562 RepID=A0A377F504_ECOLX|nr:Uncharacterised protein [Escherichia coli]
MIFQQRIDLIPFAPETPSRGHISAVLKVNCLEEIILRMALLVPFDHTHQPD